jgi:hypothetical protein
VTSRIAILYEDELGPTSKFPLHMLVGACIGDALGFTMKDIEPYMRALPKKGNSKLLSACRTETPRMPERHIFALFDADQIHRLLGVRGDTSFPDLLDQLRSRVPDERVRIFLLERNTETVVGATADCLGLPRPEIKSKVNRDDFLARAAWDHSRASRDCIRDKVPTFAAFVDALVPLVQAAITA